MRRLLRSVATLGPVGFLPIAGGTWGSLAACLVWWFGNSRLDGLQQSMLIVAMVPVAIWSASVAERDLGHDANPIVIDEVVGQWITLLIIPRSFFLALFGFVLFRVMDILKPFPVRQSQALKGGIGIVVDDILAAGYAALGLFFLSRSFGQ